MEAKDNYSDDSYFRNSSIQPKESVSSVTISLSGLSVEDKKSLNPFIPFTSVKNFSKTDFEVVELLGKGAYAKVVKAIYLPTKETKAIKIIDRSFIERVFIFNSGKQALSNLHRK
jgi:hypothetical protein